MQGQGLVEEPTEPCSMSTSWTSCPVHYRSKCRLYNFHIFFFLLYVFSSFVFSVSVTDRTLYTASFCIEAIVNDTWSYSFMQLNSVTLSYSTLPLHIVSKSHAVEMRPERILLRYYRGHAPSPTTFTGHWTCLNIAPHKYRSPELKVFVLLSSTVHLRIMSMIVFCASIFSSLVFWFSFVFVSLCNCVNCTTTS